MKQITVAGLVIIMLGSITSNSVWARGEGNGGHYGGGFGVNGRHNDGRFRGHGRHNNGEFGGNDRHNGWGLGYYGSLYYSPYYVYLPPVPQPQTNYWYYCQDPEGFYPDVEECLDDWRHLIIGTIAKTRRATIPASRSVQTAGSRWYLNRMKIN